MKVGAIIQARMGSTRLPGKVLEKIGEKPLLEHLIEFLKKVKSIDEIIIATSDRKENQKIVELAKKLNISYFVGDEEDVLDRFIQTSKKFKLDIIVRICGDSLMLDSENIDLLIQKHIKEKAEFSHNYLHKNGLPPGVGAEVFTRQVLEKVNTIVKNYVKHIYREDIDEYILQHQEEFKVLEAIPTIKDQRFQFNIDKKRDLELAREIYQHFNYDYNKLTLKNVINFVETNQEFYRHFRQIKLIFRVDGFSGLGLGHINRCMAIAQILEDKFKCEILFLINDDEEAQNFILNQGYTIKKINYKKEKEIIETLIRNYNPHLIIVDLPVKSENGYSHYENLEYLESLKAKIIKINYSLSILKKDFLNEKIKDINQKVNSILVTLGGGDEDNLTIKILKELVDIKNVKIITVLGPFFEFSDEIKHFIKNYPQITIKQNVINMAKLMNQVDLAVTAGGITLTELAYFGVPSVCVCYDKLQLKDVEYFNKATINLGFKDQVDYKNLKEKVKTLIEDFQLRKKMSLQGRKLVNEENNQKILTLIENKIFGNEN